MPALVRPVVLVALALLASPVAVVAAPGAKPLKPSDIVLPDGFTPVTEADRALAAVPFAPGAPAVVLLDAEQYEYEENYVRTRHARRIKILTEAGTRWGDYEESFFGEWRMGKIHARTILPDGTEVDASANVHVESSKDPDMTELKVTFPRVQPGAILDLAYSANADGFSIREWIPQESIPVLESRLMMTPPLGMRYKSVPVRLGPDDVDAQGLRYGTSTLFTWIFRNVPPLPSLPNQPPRSDVSKKLLLIAESYRYGDIVMPLAQDWKIYSREMFRTWEDWLKKRSTETAKLSAATTAGAATPRDKAEAVRQALRQRMSVAFMNDFPSADTPDAALAQGRGSSAEIAGVAVAMLRAAGVPAHVAAYRLRSSGSLPTAFPAPSLLDDVVVVIPGAAEGGKDLHFVAWSDLPVGRLPADVTGVHVVPFVKDSPGPTWIPDEPAEKNAIDRAVRLELGLDGTVKGEALVTLTGPAARERRAELQRMSSEERKRSLESELRELMPTAQLVAHQIDDLEDHSKDLVLATKWEAPGYAQRAGGRMLVNPFVFERVSAEDWGAETRELDVWLGRPFLRRDTVTLALPEGLASVELPQPWKLEAGEVGGYVTSYAGKDRTLTATRTLKFATTHFPAANWSPLRQWFQDMAKADDQSIVLTLAPAGE